MTTTPKRLIVVGGGPIGMEMAQAHLRLGSKVTVIEGAKAMGKDSLIAMKIMERGHHELIFE